MCIRDSYESWDKWLIGAVWVLNFIPVISIIIMALTTRFDITNHRIIYTHGILNRYREPMEIAKIRDLGTLRVWQQRPFGLGSIMIESADRSHPELTIPAQRHVDELKDWLHQLNMSERSRLGYKEFENTAAH